ncbi:MAG: hypothetical protein NTV65_10215 [Proteobacteria bacterium]|nr:hypothetical protein [Pseudomonadota bacterium]
MEEWGPQAATPFTRIQAGQATSMWDTVTLTAMASQTSLLARAPVEART